MHVLKRIWLRARSSIAFYPALIALLFLVLSALMLELDFSEAGKSLKSSYKWLRLRDAGTARSVISTVAAGLLSFTVFSFSMVMIMLTQAASQLSNRILSNLIGRPFQQVVLGFYIGTILYALFLLTAIRDIDSGIHIPALSIYLLILFTIADIFLFIYFLHFVTQSVRYETIIGDLLSETEEALKRVAADGPSKAVPEAASGHAAWVGAPESGYFQGFNRAVLLEAARDAGVRICFVCPVGTYLLAGTPVLRAEGAARLSEKEENAILAALDFYTGQSARDSYLYGFRHLTEVALRALSPGINDPATAVMCLHALGRLLAVRLAHPPATQLVDEDGGVRISTVEPSLEQLVGSYLWPIWDYGKNDRSLQAALAGLLPQLISAAANVVDAAAFRRLLSDVEAVGVGQQWNRL